MNTLIVDPYISGPYLAESLHQQGQKCFALLRNNDMAKDMIQLGRLNVTQFDDCLYAEGKSADEISSWLSEKQITCVMAGTEDSIVVADELNAAIASPYGNPVATSHLRQDKSSVLQALQKQGVSLPKTCVIDMQLPLVESIEQVRTQLIYPVFVKPSSSGGSFGIRRCHNERELHDFLKSLQDAQYAYFTTKVREVIVQRFIDAPEWVVNTVSHNGKHVISGMWVYQKSYGEGDVPIYQHAISLNLESAIFEKIKAFVCESLDAIDYQHGFAHIELFWLDNEPVMIEINLRLPGAYGGMSSLEDQLYEKGPVTIWCDLIQQKTVSDNIHASTSAGIVFVANHHAAPYVVPTFDSKDFERLPGMDSCRIFQRQSSGYLAQKAIGLSDTFLYVFAHWSKKLVGCEPIGQVHNLLQHTYGLVHVE